MGDFSRATHLSVKTLRHYHQVGLLEPAAVNPDTGYRYYSAGQIPAAQVIRRLRDLEMPVADVKAVLAAPDAPAVTTSPGTAPPGNRCHRPRRPSATSPAGSPAAPAPSPRTTGPASRPSSTWNRTSTPSPAA